MFRRVNSSPVFFSQPLEIKDGQRLRRFKSITEEMGDLLRDRSMLTLGPGLKLPVENVGKILDVQDRHVHTPKFLHYGVIAVLSQDVLKQRFNTAFITYILGY